MLHIAQGTSSPQTNPSDWVNYLNNPNSIGGFYIDVDTSNCGFTAVPHYTVSIEGTGGWNWHLSGLNCLYNVTQNGFRVYLRWTDDPSSSVPNGSTNEPNPLRISTAVAKGWTLKWTGIQTENC